MSDHEEDIFLDNQEWIHTSKPVLLAGFHWTLYIPLFFIFKIPYITLTIWLIAGVIKAISVFTKLKVRNLFKFTPRLISARIFCKGARPINKKDLRKIIIKM